MKRTYLIIITTVLIYLIGHCFYPKNDVAVSKDLTLEGVSVVIDPGHGGC